MYSWKLSPGGNQSQIKRCSYVFMLHKRKMTRVTAANAEGRWKHALYKISLWPLLTGKTSVTHSKKGTNTSNGWRINIAGQVFLVTPFKIDQNQNRSINKVQNNGKCNVLPIFIEICIKTACWCQSVWSPTWWPEISRNICSWFLQRKRELSLEKLINIKVILFLIHELFR